MTWQGILTDSAGHVHLGAIVAGSPFRRREYLDLLTPVGACSVRDLDLERIVVLVHGEQVDDVCRLAERCIDDERLRDRLVALLELSAAAEPGRDQLSRLATPTTVTDSSQRSQFGLVGRICDTLASD